MSVRLHLLTNTLLLFRWFHMTVLNIHIALDTFLIISSVATSIHVSLHCGCTFNISFNFIIPTYALNVKIKLSIYLSIYLWQSQTTLKYPLMPVMEYCCRTTLWWRTLSPLMMGCHRNQWCRLVKALGCHWGLVWWWIKT